MFFFCSYHVNTPMSNILYDRTKRDKPFGGYPFRPEVAPPTSWQARRAGRESDRVVRALRPGNAGGAKDPDLWRAFDEDEDGGLAMSLQTPDKIRTLQRKLYLKTKADPDFRFYLLYDKIYREDILLHAYRLARANKGAPGVDGQSFAMIEADGREEWLSSLREDLRAKTYRPSPVRRVMIPKPGGGARPLGIPTIRDRVVQTAVKLVIEPIFEAVLDPNAYGYRPRRRATDAIQRVGELLRSGHTDVVDGPGFSPGSVEVFRHHPARATDAIGGPADCRPPRLAPHQAVAQGTGRGDPW